MDTWTLEQGARQILYVPDGEELTEAEAQDYLAILGQLQDKAGLGRGIAYYRNEDLGHRMIGHVMAFTYGTPESQFETSDPPKQCPDGLASDITGGINWRYQLCAVTPPKDR